VRGAAIARLPRAAPEGERRGAEPGGVRPAKKGHGSAGSRSMQASMHALGIYINPEHVFV
jgi:hypothetical protein